MFSGDADSCICIKNLPFSPILLRMYCHTHPQLHAKRRQPKKGSALLFFPAAGAIPNTPFDVRTLHCGEAVSSDSKHDKWITQLWLRESTYKPTAPVGNTHDGARSAIEEYCSRSS
mmetsp:Transcript_23647/g.66054  ORF Transcript_23647/g.66054 Transcript_23647/m.66054 type:complete len:116 (-) Transcript_23647:338-685(-)